jgi:hypothetical protein
LLRLADILTGWASKLRKDDPVKRAADRAEARSKKSFKQEAFQSPEEAHAADDQPPTMPDDVADDATYDACIESIRTWYAAHPNVLAAHRACKPAVPDRPKSKKKADVELFRKQKAELREWEKAHASLVTMDDDDEYAKLASERAAREAKRLKWEAANPEKAKSKALAAEIESAMSDDMETAKEEARDNDERWADVKDDWIEDWKKDNWDDEQQAIFQKEFAEQWQREHRATFPQSNV